MAALFKGLRTVSFFDFGTFSLFAEVSDDLPVRKSRLLWDGVLGVGGWMLRDELLVVDGRVLSDGVASAGVRMLQDEPPVVEGGMLSDGVEGVGGRMT